MTRTATSNDQGTRKVPFFISVAFQKIFRQVGDLLFPMRCPDCGRYVSSVNRWPLCGECRLRIEELSGSICTRCGRRNFSGGLCDRCMEGLTPEPVFPIRSAARYAGPVRSAILAAKAGGREDIAGLLALPLVPILEDMLDSRSPLDVVPVPLHGDRIRSLGFSLPDRIAAKLAAELAGRYRPMWLIRNRHTPSQVGLDFEGRVANVAEAFSLGRCPPLEGRQVLLVDDVATSGATLASAADPLIEAGAKVVGATVARI